MRAKVHERDSSNATGDFLFLKQYPKNLFDRTREAQVSNSGAQNENSAVTLDLAA